MKLGVITADQTARAKSHLQQLELLALFDFVLGSDQATSSKPFPDLAYVAKEQFQVSLEKAVMIGDSNADMLFAKMLACAFPLASFLVPHTQRIIYLMQPQLLKRMTNLFSPC